MPNSIAWRFFRPSVMHNRHQPETGEPQEPHANSNVKVTNSNVVNTGDEHSAVRRHRQQQLGSTPVVPAATHP